MNRTDVTFSVITTRIWTMGGPWHLKKGVQVKKKGGPETIHIFALKKMGSNIKLI